MAKRHLPASVIATCVVTQQAQRRHSTDISEREHRQKGEIASRGCRIASCDQRDKPRPNHRNASLLATR
eukprot:175020-Prymnesium_polylepis.1